MLGHELVRRACPTVLGHELVRRASPTVLGHELVRREVKGRSDKVVPSPTRRVPLERGPSRSDPSDRTGHGGTTIYPVHRVDGSM